MAVARNGGGGGTAVLAPEVRQAYAEYNALAYQQPGGFWESGGGQLLTAAAYVFPEIAPFVTAERVIESGRITPQQLLKIGGSVADFWDDGGTGSDWSLPDVIGGFERVVNIFRGDTGTTTRLITDSGDDAGSTMPVSVGGAIGTAVAAGGLWLGTYLARSLGRGAAGAIYTAANGLRVRIAQLWPLVRKYGAQNVAGALGITVGALGTMLLEPGAQAGTRRKRRRGISARDVTTTRRTIRQLRSLTRMAGIKTGGGGYRRRTWIPPHRHRSY